MPKLLLRLLFTNKPLVRFLPQKYLKAVLFCLTLLSLATPAYAKLKVVTTFTVIADMTQNIAGNHAQVVSITKPGADIHNYQPTPGDLVRASDADLILRNGLGLERWFDQFLRNLGDMPTVVVTEGIEPIIIGDGQYKGQANPHSWMGPKDALIYINNIRDALIQYDPEHASAYKRNAKNYKNRLKDIITPLQEKLRAVPKQKRWLVSCEGAFGYLTRSTGLKPLYLWPINAENIARPQQIRFVIDQVNKHHIPAVFCESTISSKPAKRIAKETGAKFGGVLYVDSLSEPNGPVPTYLDLLRVDLETITRALKSDYVTSQ